MERVEAGAPQSGGPRPPRLAPPLPWARPLNEARPPGLLERLAEEGGAYLGRGSPSHRCLGSA